jgi:hypothetical protein
MDEEKVYPLFLSGFLFCLLLAIQDISVDGWSVELLSEKNVSYGSTA